MYTLQTFRLSEHWPTERNLMTVIKIPGIIGILTFSWVPERPSKNTRVAVGIDCSAMYAVRGFNNVMYHVVIMLNIFNFSTTQWYEESEQALFCLLIGKGRSKFSRDARPFRLSVRSKNPHYILVYKCCLLFDPSSGC